LERELKIFINVNGYSNPKYILSIIQHESYIHSFLYTISFNDDLSCFTNNPSRSLTFSFIINRNINNSEQDSDSDSDSDIDNNQLNNNE